MPPPSLRAFCDPCHVKVQVLRNTEYGLGVLDRDQTPARTLKAGKTSSHRHKLVEPLKALSRKHQDSLQPCSMLRLGNKNCMCALIMHNILTTPHFFSHLDMESHPVRLWRGGVNATRQHIDHDDGPGLQTQGLEQPQADRKTVWSFKPCSLLPAHSTGICKLRVRV